MKLSDRFQSEIELEQEIDRRARIKAARLISAELLCGAAEIARSVWLAGFMIALGVIVAAAIVAM